MATNNSVNNKLANPEILSGNILDANGNRVIGVNATPSAVNYVNIFNAATTGQPSISGNGTDTNIFLSITGQGTGGVNILGCTDASAAGGRNVGEILSNTTTLTGVNLSTATPADICTVTLTPGDWDYWGWINYNANGSATVTGPQGAISKTSTTLPGITNPDITQPTAFNQATYATALTTSLTIPSGSMSVSTNTPIYLVGQINFTGGGAAVTAGGALIARRRR